jgi:hypothetical protein
VDGRSAYRIAAMKSLLILIAEISLAQLAQSNAPDAERKRALRPPSVVSWIHGTARTALPMAATTDGTLNSSTLLA